MATVNQSAELRQVLAQARDIADQSGQPLSTAHVLLALFTVPNLAELLLLERNINEETVLGQIERIEREPEESIAGLELRCERLARRCDLRQANSLHLLAALTRMPRSFAHRLLDRSGASMPELRTTALRYATHGAPRRLLRSGPGPDIGSDSTHSSDVEEPVVTLANVSVADTVGPADTMSPSDTLPSIKLPSTDHPAVHSELTPERIEPAASNRTQGPADARGSRDITPGSPPQRGADRRSVRHGRRTSDRQKVPTSADRNGGRTAASSQRDVSPYLLNRERFRWLTQLGRNLSHLAWLGRLDPVVGRDRAIEEAIDILNKRRSNNPCLVGEPGVGKTAIVEGIATRLVDDEQARGTGPSQVIIQIDVGAILAGTHLRGTLAERLRGLQDEVRQADGAVIIFIDEIHTLVGAGGGDGAHDAANELKSALARGEFPCVGATTIDEYRRFIESDMALERRFTSIHVSEPDQPTTVTILNRVVDRYSDHHGVEYHPESIEAAVQMSRRYIHDRQDPDKSLGVLDLAGAVARRAGGVVDRRTVAQVVSRMARVPLDHLMMDKPQRFLDLERHLAERIVGQCHAVRAIAETIRRNLAGFSGARPMGSFLFLGPTGVGKSELVKALAEFMFGDQDALARFDMSEYLESHSVARLVGSPPGYVGHGEGGQLTEAIRRRPYQIVLFDELEKSHRDVWNLLLQLLEEGCVTDSRGRSVDFSNTVVVMTSNIGADKIHSAGGRRIGFADDPDDGGSRDSGFERRMLDEARKVLLPELWNRIECRLVFDPLSLTQVRAIAEKIVGQRSAILHREKGIEFVVDRAAIDVLVDRGGFDPRLGARPMRQTIARLVEGPLAERILSGQIGRGDRAVVTARAGELVIEPSSESSP